MSSRRLTVQALRTLRAEIENDLTVIDRVVVQALAIFTGHASSSVPPSLAIQMALAGYLHHFYTAVEAIFERVSRVVDENPPQGREWHKALLNVMALEIAETRPAVINERTRAALDEYWGFRHVFRHAYGLNSSGRC